MVTSVNNKCKVFTSLEQSKKLAKILPITSIDFVWCIFSDGSTRLLRMDDWEVSEYAKSNVEIIPCFSLVSLLEALPYPTLYQQGDGAWGLDVWVEQVKPYSVKNAICEIDACYEMILKLHDLKLL